MAEYIEREALQKEVKRLQGIPFSTPLIVNAIEKAPKVDVVEVVRCKECKHYEIHKPSVTLNCEREGKLIPMMPTDFCSYGKRKEGAEE